MSFLVFSRSIFHPLSSNITSARRNRQSFSLSTILGFSPPRTKTKRTFSKTRREHASPSSSFSKKRPELFRAVVEQAGVMDMLRFHKFTIGWNWIADYGSSENEAEFKALYAYSPIHNVKAGTMYPSTLITTADHDDRVVPAHNFKYAAALQSAQAADNPILIRIDTRSGHGASNTTKAIEQTADIYSFIFQNLGVTPKW